MKRIKHIALLTAFTLTAYVFGIISARRNYFPTPFVLAVYKQVAPIDVEKLDFTDVSAKTEVDCEKLKQTKLMVILSLGQSNAANAGETKYAPRKGVYNFYKGKCYVAADPLLGTSGSLGNIITRLGQKIVDKQLYDNVLISTKAIAAVPVDSFMPGQKYHHRIDDAIKDLKSSGFAVTHILWTQGENDHLTSEAEYRNRFHTVLKSIRDKGVGAPIYVAISTRRNNRVNVRVQRAQRKLPDPNLNIFPGPDADNALDRCDDRYDGTHFSGSGMEKYATLWMDSLFKASAPRK